MILSSLYVGHGMLGEMVAEKAGHALVEDTCTRAKRNGCNLLMQPHDKLQGALTVSNNAEKQQRFLQVQHGWSTVRSTASSGMH
jgi:hypothetical protein